MAQGPRQTPIYTWAFDAEPAPDDDSPPARAFWEATAPLDKFFSTPRDAEAAAASLRAELLAVGIRELTLVNRGQVLYRRDLTLYGPPAEEG